MRNRRLRPFSRAARRSASSLRPRCLTQMCRSKTAPPNSILIYRLNRSMGCWQQESCRWRRLPDLLRPLDSTFAAGNRSVFAADEVLAKDRLPEKWIPVPRCPVIRVNQGSRRKPPSSS
jgi:hypothetical protein